MIFEFILKNLHIHVAYIIYLGIIPLKRLFKDSKRVFKLSLEFFDAAKAR